MLILCSFISPIMSYESHLKVTMTLWETSPEAKKFKGQSSSQASWGTCIYRNRPGNTLMNNRITTLHAIVDAFWEEGREAGKFFIQRKTILHPHEIIPENSVVRFGMGNSRQTRYCRIWQTPFVVCGKWQPLRASHGFNNLFTRS